MTEHISPLVAWRTKRVTSASRSSSYSLSRQISLSSHPGKKSSHPCSSVSFSFSYLKTAFNGSIYNNEPSQIFQITEVNMTHTAQSREQSQQLPQDLQDESTEEIEQDNRRTRRCSRKPRSAPSPSFQRYFGTHIAGVKSVVPNVEFPSVYRGRAKHLDTEMRYICGGKGFKVERKRYDCECKSNFLRRYKDEQGKLQQIYQCREICSEFGRC